MTPASYQQRKTPLTRLLGRRRPMRDTGFQDTTPAVRRDTEIFNPNDEHHEYRANLIKFVGAPLVYVPDANENPAVGFGLRVEEDAQLGRPVLVVYDHISEREKRATSMPYPFTNQLFSAVFQLNRNALIALLHRRHEGKNVFMPPVEKPIDYEHASILLRSSGFFNQLATFNASR